MTDRVDVLVRSKGEFLRFLEKRLGDRAEAEDLLQTAFLKAITQGSTLHAEEKVVPWFYQLIRNLLVDHYRHRDAVTRAMQLVATENGTATGLDEELFGATRACVRDVVDTLKPEYAELIRRVELGEEPLPRVARDLGITPNNAWVRLHRARRALRDALRATCGACTEHACLDCTCRPRGIASSPGSR
jgi:RNA polymerase sigma-70 factor (ECF subfamily)